MNTVLHYFSTLDVSRELSSELDIGDTDGEEDALLVSTLMLSKFYMKRKDFNHKSSLKSFTVRICVFKGKEVKYVQS